MKKFIAVLLSVTLLATVGCAFAVAAENGNTEVYVTVADSKGELALAAEKVQVTDIDGDGTLTINDALYAAHEKFFDGGAAKGYATAETQYGLSLTKLWGTENGYSYGYMVNNASAWSMTDPVKNGDYVAAFVYTDLKAFSDKYAYFDDFMGEEKAGKISLTLTMNAYDEEWNPVTLPVKGATITVDGKETTAVTDENGKAEVEIEANGKHIVSAKSALDTLVPAVYVVEISGGTEPTEAPAKATESSTAAPTQSGTAAPTQSASKSATTAPTQASTQKATAAGSKTANSNAVQTGTEHTMIFGVFAMAIIALAVIVALRKKYEN